MHLQRAPGLSLRIGLEIESFTVFPEDDKLWRSTHPPAWVHWDVFYKNHLKQNFAPLGAAGCVSGKGMCTTSRDQSWELHHMWMGPGRAQKSFKVQLFSHISTFHGEDLGAGWFSHLRSFVLSIHSKALPWGILVDFVMGLGT